MRAYKSVDEFVSVPTVEDHLGRNVVVTNTRAALEG